ncbi:MAG: hypothetical protein ACREHV_14980 [Rhizomicrobium sp.]
MTNAAGRSGGDWKINLIERENPHWSDPFIAGGDNRPGHDAVFRDGRDNGPAMTNVGNARALFDWGR